MNCSQTEQISCHLLIGSVSDANFVQTTQKKEFSLDQAVNLGKRESRKFHIIRFGPSIIMQILCNSHHFFYFLQGKECIEQEHKSCKFCIIRFVSSLIMRILRNSHHFSYFLHPVKNRNQELRFARFVYKHENLKLCTDGG